MIDWPKKSHWRTCSVCDAQYRVLYSRKLKRFTRWACHICRYQHVKRNFGMLILQKMAPGAHIDGVAGNSVRPKEWFMKKQLKEFLPYMVEALGAELAKDIYMEAFERYQTAITLQWERSLLSDILSRQQ